MTDDNTSRNKAYFNDEANKYDQKHAATLAEVVKSVQARAKFIGVAGSDGITPAKSPLRMLDYACGTGSLSFALEPWTTEIIGVDLTPNMVAAYTARAQVEGKGDKMRAVTANLCKPEEESSEAMSGPEFFDFDVAVVGLGFHHFDDPELAAKRLAGRLKPGGILLILDFLNYEADTHPDSHKHGVAHHGFSERRIKAIFEQAGAGREYGLEVADDIHWPQGERTMFIARGCKL